MITYKFARISVGALCLSLFAPPAFAYIDPGTGAMLVQAFMALIASIIFYFRHPRQLWRDFKNWLIRKRKE